MNRDPFLRAGLVVALTGFAAALYALFGPWRAMILAAIGLVGAFLFSVDYDAPPTRDELKERVRPRPRVDGDGKPVDFDRVRP